MSKKLSFVNYGCYGRRGAWQVGHSNPKSRGGSDYLRNLYPAHIECNQERRSASTKAARSWYGYKHAPLSKEKKKRIRRSQAVIGCIIGGVIGSVAGPWGTAGGAVLGAKFGYDLNPKKE